MLLTCQRKLTGKAGYPGNDGIGSTPAIQRPILPACLNTAVQQIRACAICPREVGKWNPKLWHRGVHPSSGRRVLSFKQRHSSTAVAQPVNPIEKKSNAAARVVTLGLQHP